jgi:threonine dehydrogenase-like Zn-dependent dehydrogenase
MSEEMMSLQIMEPGKVEWRAVAIPKPQPGQILVRIEAITTCPHWDLHLMSGEPMFPGRPLPYPYAPGQPGHEAVGVVVALGDGVDDPPVGTRVAAWRDQGHNRPGCYAQYNLFEAAHLLPVPQDLPVAALQMARAYGASEVVAVDPITERRTLALQLGADVAMTPDELHTIAPDPNDAAAMRSRKRFDAAVDCTGLPGSVSLLLLTTRKAVSVFGVMREPVAFGFAHWASGVALLGYGSHNREAAQRALQLVKDGKLRLEPLVTHQLPLHRYAEGVDLLRRKAAIKVAFLPWE